MRKREFFEISVNDKFNAYHYLTFNSKESEKPHLHNWKVNIYIRSKSLDKSGMVIDFVWLKKILKEEIREFSKKTINKHIAFRKTSPSAENVARYFYNRLRKKIKKLTKVTVEEAKGCEASYGIL